MYQLCVNRQRDLNYRTSIGDARCVESLNKPDAYGVRFEREDLAVIPSPTMRKPFDVLAEGLVSENSRDNRTAIELFLAGTRALALQTCIINAVRLALQL